MLRPTPNPEPPTLKRIDAALSKIEATREAQRVARAEVFGPRGFGHVLDRTSVVDEEAAAIRDAAKRVLAGETLSSVVHDWNRRGLKSTTGRPWRVNTLSALLIQPRLAGLHAQNGGCLVEKWPPILDRETHELLVELRSSRKLQRRAPRRSLLNGLVRCGKCGARLHYLVRSENNQYYRCPGPASGGCSGVIVKASFAEDYVRDAVIARVDSPELMAMAEEVGEPPLLPDKLVGIASAVDADRSRLKELASMWADGQITNTEWQLARRKIARRLAVKEAKVSHIESVRSALSLTCRGPELAAQWETMEVDQKRDVIQAVLDHLVVEPVGGTGGKFRPDRLRPVWRSGG